MITCNNCSKHNDCNQCGGGCKPAYYSDCLFDIASNPYNSNEWIVTLNGMPHKVQVPGFNETDTTLSTNYSNATLNYKAERHEDVITGGQLGDLINVSDLRDVKFDSGLDGHCYEFIYHKFADCGDGCKSPADSWSNFNINSDGAKKDWLMYVRGANAYGCPVYLDVPTNLDEYWYAGWRQNGEHYEFGYYQDTYVDELPKDGNGDYIVKTLNPETKEPEYGPLPLNCWINNLATTLGADVSSSWTVIQSTPQFSASFNAFTGDFVLNWNDWRGANNSVHVGAGHIYGQLHWDRKFDLKTGAFTYTLHSITWSSAHWDVDQGDGGLSHPKLTIKAVNPQDGSEVSIIDAYEYGSKTWDMQINRTIPVGATYTIAPTESVGPLKFAYIFVDWIGDDEGYLNIHFSNKLLGWENC